MKPFQILIALAFLFTACQDTATTEGGQKTADDTAKKSNQVGSTELPAEDFLNFWKNFRTAVMDNDTAQLMAMTEFPLQTRGPLDDDPIIEYNKNKFVRVFSAYLNQYNGQLEGGTESDVISNTEVPNKEDVQADNARIGDLVFNKNGKDWKLAFAYLTYSTIDSLKK